MMEELHVRAEKLIAQERVEGISASDRDWLEQHMRECTRCAEMCNATEQALRSLLGLSVPLPRTLAGRTQFRVRLRAQQLQSYEPRWRMVWIASGISWLMGAVTAPYVWRGIESIGNWAGTPKWISQMSFGVWWALPAIVAAVILLIEKGERLSDEA